MKINNKDYLKTYQQCCDRATSSTMFVKQHCYDYCDFEKERKWVVSAFTAKILHKYDFHFKCFKI